MREELPDFEVFLEVKDVVRYVSDHIGWVLRNVHLYVMYTGCMGYAVSFYCMPHYLIFCAI